MNKFGHAGLVLAAVSLGSIGCAAHADDGSGDVRDDALASATLSGAAAVEIGKVHNGNVVSRTTVGAPKKVKDVVASIKKKRASDPVPECAALNPTRLRFLDASGDTIATVENTCAGYASLEFEDGRAGYMVKVDLQSVETTRAAPFAVGDAVWGISKIELVKGRGASAEKRMVTGGRMQPILNGFDLDAVPDPQMIRPACLPAYSVTLKRGGDAVAYSTFLCSLGTPAASVGASFSAVEPGGDEVAKGGIRIDPRSVVQAFAAN